MGSWLVFVKRRTPFEEQVNQYSRGVRGPGHTKSPKVGSRRGNDVTGSQLAAGEEYLGGKKAGYYNQGLKG